MKRVAVLVMLLAGLLIACGKAETVSTDTAVTETIAPEELQTSPDAMGAAPSGSEAPAIGEQDATGGEGDSEAGNAEN